MKIVVTKLFAVFVVFWLVSVVFVFPVSASEPTLYMSPSNSSFTTDSVSPGYVFYITIWLNDSPPIAAWQVYLEFNDTFLQCIGWTEPVSDPQYFFYGLTTTASPPPPDPGYVHISPGRGRIQVSAMMFPTPPQQQARGGTGKLCILGFNVTATPPNWCVFSSVLDISNSVVLDPDGWEIFLIKENGSCTITWVAPPSPHLGLNPELKEFAERQSYDQQVFVEALSWRWFLNQTSFDLVYDASVIDAVNGSADVTVDSLWGASSIIYSAGRITVSVSQPAWNPSGDVLVATIKFTVVNQLTTPPEPPGSYTFSNLTLENVCLYDNTATSIPLEASGTGLVKVYAEVVHTLDVSATAGGSTDPVVGTYFLNGHVYVQAIPDGGYVFEYWRLDGRDIGWFSFAYVLMSANHTLLAVFGLPRNEGDINGDKAVDIRDIYTVARAYGTYPNDPRWNSLCDINHDYTVDIRDYYIACKHYGEEYP